MVEELFPFGEPKQVEQIQCNHCKGIMSFTTKDDKEDFLRNGNWLTFDTENGNVSYCRVCLSQHSNASVAGLT